MDLKITFPASSVGMEFGKEGDPVSCRWAMEEGGVNPRENLKLISDQEKYMCTSELCFMHYFLC